MQIKVLKTQKELGEGEIYKRWYKIANKFPNLRKLITSCEKAVSQVFRVIYRFYEVEKLVDDPRKLIPGRISIDIIMGNYFGKKSLQKVKS